MILYKVHLDMAAALPILKRYDLEKYNSSTPIIFISANDPDDACHIAFKDLVRILYRQNTTYNTLTLTKQISYLVRIIKVEVPQE
jgi:hypothetical protein